MILLSQLLGMQNYKLKCQKNGFHSSSLYDFNWSYLYGFNCSSLYD